MSSNKIQINDMVCILLECPKINFNVKLKDILNTIPEAIDWFKNPIFIL